MQTNSNTPSVAPAPCASAAAADSRISAVRPASITYHDKDELANAIGDIAKRAKRLLVALDDPESPYVGPTSESGLYFHLLGAVKRAEAAVHVSPTVIAIPIGVNPDGGGDGVDPLLPNEDPVTGVLSCDPGLVLKGRLCYPEG